MPIIHWRDEDGAEHEERWPSVEGFRAWALAQGRRIAYAAYEEDADGDGILIDRGRLGGG